MDTLQHMHAGQAYLLQLFETRSQAILHETCGDDCHAFEIYEGRNALVRAAAYRLAQARGFAPGRELDDWLAAEHEVDAHLFASIAPVGFVG